MADEGLMTRQEFHAELAKVQSRLDRLASRVHALGEDRIARLEQEVGEVRRLLENALQTAPSWNEGR